MTETEDTILSRPFLPATTFPKLKEGRFRQSRMVILIKMLLAQKFSVIIL